MPTTSLSLKRKPYDNDGNATETSIDQTRTENSLYQFFFSYLKDTTKNSKIVNMLREKHVNYCLSGLNKLGSGYECLDASRPWLCYWMLNSLDLLGALDDDLLEKIGKKVANFLCGYCQNEEGGFEGGPLQFSHLAPTYAAVNSLVIVGRYEMIDRDKLYQFLLQMKDPVTGGFRMHHDGEVDIRGCYCALSVAHLLGLLTEDLMEGVEQYVNACQTYEGGFGSYPGNEAHGGYTFCGLASLILMNKTKSLNLKSLIHWNIMRQMPKEGGFQGRTNKLVDSCYSFWVGGVFPLYQALISERQVLKSQVDIDMMNYVQMDTSNCNVATIPPELSYLSPQQNIFDDAISSPINQVTIEEVNEQKKKDDIYVELENQEWIFDQTALQEYLLLCCQLNEGGMRDKPGKSRDFYHTCYALNGLSIAQNNPSGKKSVLGPEKNLLRELNPIFGICKDRVSKVWKAFGNRTHL